MSLCIYMYIYTYIYIIYNTYIIYIYVYIDKSGLAYLPFCAAKTNVFVIWNAQIEQIWAIRKIHALRGCLGRVVFRALACTVQASQQSTRYNPCRLRLAIDHCSFPWGCFRIVSSTPSPKPERNYFRRRPPQRDACGEHVRWYGKGLGPIWLPEPNENIGFM